VVPTGIPMAGSAKNFTPGTAPRQPRYRFELLIAPGMRSNYPASILGWVLAVNGMHATGNDGRDDDDPYGEERERREGGGAERPVGLKNSSPDVRSVSGQAAWRYSLITPPRT
jgi:hypothetical protein